MESTEDLQLAQDAATGNTEAAERIVRGHYEGVHRLARHLSRSHTDAQDLAQLTFIRACRSIGRYDGRASMRAWLAGILVHEYSHWKRSRRLWTDLKERLAPDPTIEILDRELLLQAIHRLPPNLRETFLLVEVHGFAQDEAGAALDVPVGTVKSRLHNARLRLQKRLGDSTVQQLAAKEASNEC